MRFFVYLLAIAGLFIPFAAYATACVVEPEMPKEISYDFEESSPEGRNFLGVWEGQWRHPESRTDTNKHILVVEKIASSSVRIRYSTGCWKKSEWGVHIKRQIYPMDEVFSGITNNGNTIVFKLPKARATVTYTLHDRDKLAGTWGHRNYTNTISMRRIDSPISNLSHE